jgi:hypothetical protein
VAKNNSVRIVAERYGRNQNHINTSTDGDQCVPWHHSISREDKCLDLDRTVRKNETQWWAVSES